MTPPPFVFPLTHRHTSVHAFLEIRWFHKHLGRETDMEVKLSAPVPKIYFPNVVTSTGIQISPLSRTANSISNFSLLNSSSLNPITQKPHVNSLHKTHNTDDKNERNIEATIPTMSDILEVSRAQNLHLRLQTLGPFFRITAKSLETQRELGRAEGLVRVWLGNRILHLDSIRLRRETLGLERSIFGTGLFIGAVAIRHGYDCGCTTAELLAINDSELYHSKLVRFYTRIGFKAVREVTGSSMGDLPHMLVWGGIGTRMDAKVEELLIKWCTRFKSRS